MSSTLKRLIAAKDVVSTEDLSDILLIFAANAEDALMEAGAIPGKDYSYLDCFRLGQPFAIKHYQEFGKHFSIKWE